ncbi:MAG: transposase, partial [Verrucomicrobia bacterium]|nr:transposase [Verrucomicrobiota bacterium]
AQVFGIDLTLVPGLNRVGVLLILSEIGADLKRWRDGAAFAAWLGLAPGSKISGGKILSRRTPMSSTGSQCSCGWRPWLLGGPILAWAYFTDASKPGTEPPKP